MWDTIRDQSAVRTNSKLVRDTTSDGIPRNRFPLLPSHITRSQADSNRLQRKSRGPFLAYLRLVRRTQSHSTVPVVNLSDIYPAMAHSSLLAQLEELRRSPPGNNETRSAVHNALVSTAYALERPIDTLFRLAFTVRFQHHVALASAE